MMWGLSRKTRGALMRSELGESWEHLMAAAGHAAGGVGKSVGPRASMLRGVARRGWGSTASALTPLATAYRAGAADATAAALKLRKKAQTGRRAMSVSNRRSGMLIGLLTAGAAVGAVGAMMMRRRRRQRWSEYDATAAMDTMTADARAMLDRAASTGGGAMDKMAQHAGGAMDKTADKLQSAASSMRRSDFKGKASDAAERASEATDKMAPKYGGSPSQNKPQ